MRIPPGVSSADFASAIEQFGAAVGKDWVLTSDEAVATYRDAYSPLWGEPDEKVASAAVAPETVPQVQQIVRIANRYSIPLFVNPGSKAPITPLIGIANPEPDPLRYGAYQKAEWRRIFPIANIPA